MTAIRKYNGQYWLPSLFNELFENEWPARPSSTAPAVNISESKTEYVVEVAAPGMTKEDFALQIGDEGELCIVMEKKSTNTENDKTRRYLRRDFSYAKFSQTFVMPEDVDREKISASMSEGVLYITLPKYTQEERTKINRIIEIQ